jgi:redox-sensitive bicupin YhaK (pirin superfamily)
MGEALYAGSDRSSTSAPGRTTRHSFSFGEHYDPTNLGFGPMLCHNDDDLDPGAGYPDHPHTDLEIVTWVLEGSLVHTGSTGSRHVLEAGRAQVLSAGSGVRHSEVADAASGRCRFVQVWLAPASPGGEPSYVAGDAPSLGTGSGSASGFGLVEVAGGSGLPIGTAGARLLVARLAAGESVRLPEDPRQHVFAATGAATLGGLSLRAGDAVRLVDEPGRLVRADAATELLVWSFA